MPATFVPREPRSNERSVQLLMRSLQPTASERAESPDVDSSSDSSSNRESDSSNNSGGSSDSGSKLEEITSTRDDDNSGKVGGAGKAKTRDKEDKQTGQAKEGTETSAGVVPTIVMSDNVYRA